MCAAEYLESTIGDIIKDIYVNKVYIEVDPTRIEKNEDIHVHLKQLYQYCCLIWERISQSFDRVPTYVFARQLFRIVVFIKFHSELRVLFHHLQRSVIKRFGNNREDRYLSVRYTAVSGFLFLRLFCPAILNPKLFDLIRGMFLCRNNVLTFN